MHEWSETGAMLDEVVKMLHDKCLSFFGKDDKGNTVIIDPVEHREIGAHYAMTHIAAALIVSGKRNGIQKDLERGVDLLNGVLARWYEDTQNADFHYDFNQFALCLIWKELQGDEQYLELCESIKNTVLHTGDSRHFTINWLPMRMYVNMNRSAWTKDPQYMQNVERLYEVIESATNADGFIEDLLPKGKSFNLQYNAATVAVLQFLNDNGAAYMLDGQVEALLHACDPEGDINYLGRGCNQIFAWGLWIYLLKSRGLAQECLLSMRYLARYVGQAISQDNLLLNEYPGTQKMLWWDYHYASVYLGHLYLWLTLAAALPPKENGEVILSKKYGSDSGVNIVRAENYFVCLFEGRKQYLAEYGPVIANVWLKDQGYLMKGTFGPWMGQFGRKYSAFFSFFNYFGPICLGDYGEFRFHRFHVQLKSFRKGDFVIPKVRIEMEEEQDRLLIRFWMKRKKKALMNLPLFDPNLISRISVRADQKKVNFRNVGDICNQYGKIPVYQTEIESAEVWSVTVEL